MGRPAGKSSEETRAEILAAAHKQFARVGYERATNRDIAADAGVTAAAIYKYFASKADLFAAVATETMETLMPDLLKAARSAPSARRALVALLRTQLAAAQHVEATRFLTTIPIEMKRHPEVAEALVGQPGPIFELVVEVVERGVREGEIARGKAEQVVGMYIAILIGLAIHGSTVPASHNAAAVQGFFDLLDGKLFRPPGA
ncbi:MAG: TetR/AcrR family transcriptional regulator [Myxococcales bacterium]|nr:TetR/AcrR family transcriptional regulator [Myxococcales bacterium]MDD9965155.1 TetR/AcrR family transcriptional regulator [Myxococcales bacterium]